MPSRQFMKNWRHRKLELAAWVLCIATSETVILLAGSFEFSLADAIGVLLFSVWGAAPCVALWIFIGRAMRYERDRAWIWIGRALAAASFALTALAYLDAMYLHVSSTSGLVVIFVPLWVGVGGAMTIALAQGLLKRRAHGERAVCSTCGYDLTANVSGVCPECGEAT